MEQKDEQILSAGIDIGTTTTQLVFSRITLSRSGGWGTVAKISVSGREILYRSDIHLTPLSENGDIDAGRTASIIREEYQKAGMRPEMLRTGAVIITGETAEKRNAKQVVSEISDLAGDFIVASAGPDFESYLAGMGSGACRISGEEMTDVLNLDIGGGTTNLALFHEGELVDTACTDVGGHLIKLDAGQRILGISPKLENLLARIRTDRAVAERCGLPPHLAEQIRVGEILTEEAGMAVGRLLAEVLAETADLRPMTEIGRYFLTNHGLKENSQAKILTFSGGVADCFAEKNLFRWNDLGVFLAKAVGEQEAFRTVKKERPGETLRATVIGAGNCSMKVSGSTIACEKAGFPLKNYPVYPLHFRTKEDLNAMKLQLAEIEAERRENPSAGFSIGMEGPSCPGFAEVEQLADLLAPVLKKEDRVVPVILEHDFAKALGQSLRRRLGKNFPILCLDGISAKKGDFIDILEPVAGGIAVPVIVKTLVFKSAA